MNGKEHSSIPPDELPVPGDMWEIRNFVDVEKGVEIQMAISPNPLVAPRFRGTLQLMTPRGPTTIGFEIPDVLTIQEAAARWNAAARTAIADFKRDLENAQRRIVVPGALNTGKIPFQMKKVN